MNRKSSSTVITVAAVALIFSPGAALSQSEATKLRFERDILPILSERCLKCHGTDTPAAGLDLRTAASALKGSAQGPVILSGSADKSPLVLRISNRTMPPKGTLQPLSDEQIELIRRWIEGGALSEQPVSSAVSQPAASPAPAVSQSPEITAKDRDFWAFRPPVRPPAPKVKNSRLARTTIDAFVLAQLESKGLTLSPEAPKLALMRRAYLDLVGLPPTLDEIQSYLADTKPDAYDRMIDRLLASPHYGERWGRHWLDAAGYNDEQGFANDLSILVLNQGIWRYRDYVIRSFNQDKPYNQFLTEQLAGDEMVDWRNAPKYTPEILEKLTATGYLRTMTDLTDSSEVNLPPYYIDVLTRVVDNFSSGVLGLTGGCARCHSHKYDPIPQRDYYRMLAVFATGYNPEAWKQPKERFLPDVSKAEQEEIARHNAEIDRPLNELTKQLASIRHPYEQRLLASKLEAAVAEPLRADIRAAFETPADKRTDIQKYFFRKLEKQLTVSSEEVDKLLTEPEKAASDKLRNKIETLKAWRRSFDKVQALWDLGKPPTIHLLRRGQFETPGEVVQPGFLTVLSEPGKSDAVRPPDTQGESSGRRLALAHWLARRDHPLTARVIVNRIWMHHFSKGIVATPENFGRIGARPTHPELLDWLAVDFMENGWTMKRLHRMIMTSAVYRQSSRRAPEDQTSLAEKVDPGNDLLWRMNLRRLEAEALRDEVLAASGKLDKKMGGEPVALDSSVDGLVTVAEKGPTPTNRFRRSVYLLARRNYSTSFLDVFDFPIMSLNCTRRTNSATPLQSLSMLNSEFMMQRAEDFAERITENTPAAAAAEKKIETAFLIALGRKPTPEEARWSAEQIEKETRRYAELKTPPEESSKKALASVCQMLMATNEFLYVE